MGKSIKGKECGKGIFQRKDGWYIARFIDKYGTRHEKYFKTLSETRNWQADSQYQDRHGSIVVPVNMTVDTWFDYWIQNIVGDLAPNTLRNYRERYTKPVRAKRDWKRNATQGFAEAFRTREYSNHHESICARHERFYAKGRILV